MVGGGRGNVKMAKYCFQGLRDWRRQNAKKIERSDEEKKESLGTQLGRSKSALVKMEHSAEC